MFFSINWFLKEIRMLDGNWKYFKSNFLFSKHQINSGFLSEIHPKGYWFIKPDYNKYYFICFTIKWARGAFDKLLEYANIIEDYKSPFPMAMGPTPLAYRIFSFVCLHMLTYRCVYMPGVCVCLCSYRCICIWVYHTCI